MIQQNRDVDGAQDGARQRVIECRRRLRRVRVVQRTLRGAQDQAVIVKAEILSIVADETDFANSEEIFEEAGASCSKETRRLTPEVDRRAQARAR